jgi:cell wall-associated NlpC family hydrolase
MTLLSQGSAQAAPADPKPSIDEVQRKVDELYQQAGSATQRYNAAEERTDRQRKKSNKLLDQVAKQTQKLNESRRLLGSYAAAQYRTGAISPTASLLLADDPQSYFDQNQLLDRLSARQHQAVEDYTEQRTEVAEQRDEATRSLETLTESQKELAEGKREVQRKLAAARELLAELTAEEKARLAALEKKREEEAKRKAEELARKQAEAAAAAEQSQERQPETGTGTDTSSSAAKAAKVISFAEAQLGKPYVWGATGPNSYDCSGLTQDAWKAAGISLPRTTWDQVKVGTRVATADLRPGDLVFFYDDISHVGIYIGDGKMIHAPKPGTNVRVESIYYMPIYGGVRPA